MSQTVDPKQYYGYLFETDKKPTKVLDTLLRGIANYISDFLGNKDEKALTPSKLASFYKAVGGNYDSLFVDVPHPSISWIYISIGCQHTLQPTSNDFEPPSIPALTTKGFARWQAIEILLGPEEHVPFIQNAVRNFALKNPDNGESFPVDLPKEAFPLHPDKEIEKWHSACAEKLRQQATPIDDDDQGRKPTLHPRPKVQSGYAHVRQHHSPHSRPVSGEYFESRTRPQTRPIPYSHVSGTGRPMRPKLSHSPSHRSHQFLAPEETRMSRGRRRSLPENVNSPPVTSPAAAEAAFNLRPPEAHQSHMRRHSHPRHARQGSVSSDASSEDESPPSPTSPNVGRRRGSGYIHGSPSSQAANDVPPIRVAVATPPEPRMRREQDEEELRKLKSFPIPIDLSGKLSAPFLLGRRAEEERRSNSKSDRGVKWKDLDSNGPQQALRRNSKDSSPNDSPRDDRPLSRRHSRDERLGRSDYKRREREYVAGSGRPRMSGRRSSSLEEGRRRDRSLDRERLDREFESDRRAGRGSRYETNSKDRDRERRSDRERSPGKGVDGRRYPAASGYR